MGGLERLPVGESFTRWRPTLKETLSSTCPSDGWRFQAPSMRLGHELFTKSFSNVDNAEALGDVLRHNLSASEYYFGHHFSSFFLLLCGGILLLAAIFAAVAINRNVRGWVSKWCWGNCRQRTRVRMKAVQPHHRGFLIYSNIVGCVIVLLTAGFTFALCTQGIQGVNRTVCSMWMEVYGHFFGTAEFAKSEVERVAMTWSGTNGILEQLEKLDHKVLPSDHNPILQVLQQGYEDLKLSSWIAGNDTAEIVKRLMDHSDQWIKLFDEASGRLSGVDPNLWILPTAKSAVAKGDTFLHELDETLETGWVEIERLLAQYAGPQSLLMQKASAAVVDTIDTVNDVDLLAAELALTWSDIEGTVNGGLKSLFGISIALNILGVLSVGGILLLASRLVDHIRHDRFPVRRERQFWATQYIIFVLLAGLSALMCGVFYTATVIGHDVCYVGDQMLIEEGNWDLLPDSVLAPVEDMRVDVNIVLDTCVREDGSGDVAASLALDGRIAELADDVEVAKIDVWSTRDAILKTKEKIIKTELISGAYRDLLDTTLRRKPSVYGFPVGHAAFNDTEFIRADWFESKYSEHPDYPGLYGYNDGIKSILCIVPELNSGEFLSDCLGQGLQLNVVPINVGMDRLNEASDLLHKTLQLPTFPRYFCSPIARQNDYPSCKFDEGRHDISAETFQLLPSWQSEIAQALEPLAIDDWRHPLFAIDLKIKDLIHQLINIEELRALQLSSLTPQAMIQCGSAATDCTLAEAKESSRQRFRLDADQVVPRTKELLSFVDDYVDGLVTPVMDELVDEANQVSEGANCQFEGTALRHGVLPPLCESSFPAFGILTILSGVSSVVFGLMAVHTWKWYHYMEDIAVECHDDALEYEVQKAPSTLMSARPEFMALYTGISAFPKVVQRVPSVEDEP